jgi:hypothetical protein
MRRALLVYLLKFQGRRVKSFIPRSNASGYEYVDDDEKTDQMVRPSRAVPNAWAFQPRISWPRTAGCMAFAHTCVCDGHVSDRAVIGARVAGA